MDKIKYTSAVSVDKGLIRNNNEDNFYIGGDFLNPDNRDLSNTISFNPSEPVEIYGVFDGMGGEAMGEEASFLAAQAVEKAHKRIEAGEKDVVKTVLSAIEDANTKICRKMIESGEKRIGTTFASLVIKNDIATVINVGDSRVYLLRKGKMRQISTDDTTAQRLVNMGVISQEKAKTHKDRHKLTQHLGIFRDEMLIEPHIAKEIKVEGGDKFLLCSDGLTDMLGDDKISKILNKDKSAEELSLDLLNGALKKGGKDNVTTLVVCAQTNKSKKALARSKKLFPIKIVAIILAAVLAVFGTTTIYKTKKQQEEAAKQINFLNPVYEVEVGREDVFMVGGASADEEFTPVFSSSDENIIAIDSETGFYKALAPGSAIVRAETEASSCEIEVTVHDKEEVCEVKTDEEEKKANESEKDKPKEPGEDKSIKTEKENKIEKKQVKPQKEKKTEKKENKVAPVTSDGRQTQKPTESTPASPPPPQEPAADTPPVKDLPPVKAPPPTQDTKPTVEKVIPSESEVTNQPVETGN